MKVLVCTVVHNPTDARIFRREIGALLDAGATVTAIAPWKAETPADDRIIRVPVPRAVGRRRFRALRAARARLRDLGATHDVVIVHDPELLLVVPWRDLKRSDTAVIWDVHEDLAAAVLTKDYIPALLRNSFAAAVRVLERWAESRCTLLLAEKGYQQRFRRTHAQVLNLPLVPHQLPTTQPQRRAIYVGSITQHRGCGLMAELARALAPHGISVKVIGETHSAADAELLRSTPNLEWNGPLPNAQAMQEVEQSMFGLSLLADIPNYRHSMPTKVLEYMGAGAVVVSTPLPLAVEAVAADGVILDSFGPECLEQAVTAMAQLAVDDERRQQLAQRAHARVLADYNWYVDGKKFVAEVEKACQRA